jgi:hypothetical protein
MRWLDIDRRDQMTNAISVRRAKRRQAAPSEVELGKNLEKSRGWMRRASDEAMKLAGDYAAGFFSRRLFIGNSKQINTNLIVCNF